jgi:hypothetical protein
MQYLGAAESRESIQVDSEEVSGKGGSEHEGASPQV